MKIIVLCLCAALAGVSVAGTSASVRIVPRSVSTAHWASIRSSVVSIPVVIPDGCDSATLAITNLAGEVVVSQSFNADATYAWTVFSGAAPKEVRIPPARAPTHACSGCQAPRLSFIHVLACV